MGDELFESLRDKNIESFETILEKELLNNQITNFCQRLLNKHNFGSNSNFLYAIIWNLEKICDNKNGSN